MAWSVFPLRMIVFQGLFLWVAIACEAFVLHRQLSISRKNSVEYATSINLFSAVVGWLIFFIVQPLLPISLKAGLLGFIFFYEGLGYAFTWIVLAGFITFFITLWLKVLGLELLQKLLQVEQVKAPEETGRAYTYRDQLHRKQALKATRKRISALLLANAFSYSAISLMILAQYSYAKSLNPLSLFFQ